MSGSAARRSTLVLLGLGLWLARIGSFRACLASDNLNSVKSRGDEGPSFILDLPIGGAF